MKEPNYHVVYICDVNLYAPNNPNIDGINGGQSRRDIFNDFLYCELARVLHQAAELEAAMKLHQAQMKDVCYSIKAHYHWANFAEHFPFELQCKRCGDNISPEFARLRHTGFCKQRARLELEAGLYLPESSWV